MDPQLARGIALLTPLFIAIFFIILIGVPYLLKIFFFGDEEWDGEEWFILIVLFWSTVSVLAGLTLILSYVIF